MFFSSKLQKQKGRSSFQQDLDPEAHHYDEFVEPGWLHRLFATAVEYHAGAVLGPVKAHYSGDPPRWLVKSGLCLRESFPTGTKLESAKYMRTGRIDPKSDY